MFVFFGRRAPEGVLQKADCARAGLDTVLISVGGGRGDANMALWTRRDYLLLSSNPTLLYAKDH